MKKGQIRMRRFGDPPRKGQYYQRRPGAYAILPMGQNVLLTYQNAPDPEFQLPGGGIDQGESPVNALHREVFEETGWLIGKIRRLGAFRRFVFMPEYDMWADKICHIFVAKPIRCLGAPTEQGHIAVITPQQKAIELVANPGDAHFLRLSLTRHPLARKPAVKESHS